MLAAVAFGNRRTSGSARLRLHTAQSGIPAERAHRNHLDCPEKHHVVGFSTFGELHRGIHVNQTFTGVAFGQALLELSPMIEDAPGFRHLTASP